jgi:hypothetical protein
MLLAVGIPLISDHSRFVARLFRVQVDFEGRDGYEHPEPGAPKFKGLAKRPS